MYRKGQASFIINAITFSIVVVVAAVLTPMLLEFLNDIITTYSITGTTLLLMDSIVPFFWLGVITIWFVLIRPNTQIQSF